MNSNYRRIKYLNQIKPFIGKSIIKVLTGQRRVGKTTILLQIMEMISLEEVDCNSIYINKEHHDYRLIREAEDLYQYIKSKCIATKKNYVFIDEIQEINQFEIALRQLLLEDIDLYCTGSNAKMLSGDLATHLSGRYIEFHIGSLSYSEFLEIHHLDNTNESLNKYILFGGLPYLIHLPFEDEVIYGYLKSVYNTIILKDIVTRYSIRDLEFLDRLVEYLSDNVGNYISSKKIADYLKTQKISLSVNTVMNYLKFLTDSFFINKVERYDIIGKKRFEINDKYFFSDLGLKHSNIQFSGQQIGSVFENLVYNQLIYKDYKVFIGKLKDKEIDFVAQKGNEVKYIQVAYQLPDRSVREREFGNLMNIPDNYEKIVVSADEFTSDYQGIKHRHIREFLSE